ncbi:MAG TPA: right-handed parallel beta-helix repeat-containing protein [Solirubrobacterales bacterium]|nr:right-handed parallel beta-helix repeat-containing protein [Solirubrobacterales bacterium]
MNLRRRVALTLLAALFALAFPAVASAVVYEVNTNVDEAKKAECEAHIAGCTLRGAIEAANATAGVPDEIKFAENPFNGQVGDTISTGTPMPTITDQVKILGGRCDTSAGIKGPCAGVIKAGVGFLFQVEDDDVEIQGLAINGGLIGVNVINASERFVAKGNWIGFDLSGLPSGNGTGIFVDPGSDGAVIGGTAEADRNVIGGNAGLGLDLEGASGATIQGNYFGVRPKGDVAASNAVDIEITDSTASGGFPAENNEVGETIEGATLTTAACDGGCNVISGSQSTGLDLNGSGLAEEPASGPTTVHGNFVGLKPSGTDLAANGGAGIYVGGADHATVGGSAEGDTNFVAGGEEGIASGSGSDDFLALRNSIGFNSNGSATTPPSVYGIFALAESVTEEPEIDTNDVRMAGGVGIETRSKTGRIIDNDVEGGVNGILAGFGEGGGLIAGNTVEASSAAGILIESGNNDVRNNTVLNAGAAGIAVKPPKEIIATTGNLIGSDEEGEGNTIEGSAGAAIEIFEEAGEPGSWTEIARNNGSGNGGLFIHLKPGANEGVLPPAISAATKTSVEGSGAEENATIRVFRKASSEAGELQSFLGETQADASGNWKLTYSVPGGTIVAATQTKETGATSELSTATVPSDPSGGGGSGGGGNGGGGGAAADTIAPTAKITKGPKAKSTSTTAKFKFKSNEGGSKFQCKLDKGKFKNCKSPKTYKKLKVGKHVFKVRAIDKAGNVGKAVKRKFTVMAS